MLGPILVTLLVAAIVGTYMTIVTRLLQSDEHWNETQITPTPAPKPTRYRGGVGAPGHA